MRRLAKRAPRCRRAPRIRGFILVAAGLASAPVLPSPGLAQGPESPVRVGLGGLATDDGVALSSWLYGPAEGPDEPPPPGVEQVVVPSALRIADLPADWPGSGWFRVELDVAPDAARRLLALTFSRHNGASVVTLDGERLGEIGALPGSPEGYRPASPSEPLFFTLDAPGPHELAIYFANPDAGRFHRVGYPAGFEAQLATAEAAAARLVAEQRLVAGSRGLYVGIFLSFTLLHALLFAFRRESLENLHFAAFCASLAALAFLLTHKPLVADPRIVFWSEATMNVAGIAFAVCGVLFVHRIFRGELPGYWKWASAPVAALVLWSVLRPAAALGAVFLTMLAGLVEMARATAVAVVRRTPGARVVGVGILAVALGFGAGVLATMGVLPRVTALTFVAPFSSVLVLIVSMSVFLSWHFAVTQRELEAQLERVEELSAEALAQERMRREEVVQRKLLEVEMARKEEELEEARKLQVSMLPKAIPEHPELEIAVHMTTATEVGSDYYDFTLEDDGSLTLAIGDATGHGMRAGTMVTATKSLFSALGSGPDLVETVTRKNAALKRMNLRTLNMALILARFGGGILRIAAAGMPFPLVHRAADGAVEPIELGGMPLGSVRSFPYRAVDVALEPGDTVLFMSDGFPERLDPRAEMLGYERVSELFAAAATLPPAAVVSHLVEAGESWAAGAALEDDVTFVVLRVRGPSAA